MAPCNQSTAFVTAEEEDLGALMTTINNLKIFATVIDKLEVIKKGVVVAKDEFETDWFRLPEELADCFSRLQAVVNIDNSDPMREAKERLMEEVVTLKKIVDEVCPPVGSFNNDDYIEMSAAGQLEVTGPEYGEDTGQQEWTGHSENRSHHLSCDAEEKKHDDNIEMSASNQLAVKTPEFGEDTRQQGWGGQSEIQSHHIRCDAGEKHDDNIEMSASDQLTVKIPEYGEDTGQREWTGHSENRSQHISCDGEEKKHDDNIEMSASDQLAVKAPEYGEDTKQQEWSGQSEIQSHYISCDSVEKQHDDNIEMSASDQFAIKIPEYEDDTGQQEWSGQSEIESNYTICDSVEKKHVDYIEMYATDQLSGTNPEYGEDTGHEEQTGLNQSQDISCDSVEKKHDCESSRAEFCEQDIYSREQVANQGRDLLNQRPKNSVRCRRGNAVQEIEEEYSDEKKENVIEREFEGAMSESAGSKLKDHSTGSESESRSRDMSWDRVGASSGTFYREQERVTEKVWNQRISSAELKQTEDVDGLLVELPRSYSETRSKNKKKGRRDKFFAKFARWFCATTHEYGKDKIKRKKKRYGFY